MFAASILFRDQIKQTNKYRLLGKAAEALGIDEREEILKVLSGAIIRETNAFNFYYKDFPSLPGQIIYPY